MEKLILEMLEKADIYDVYFAKGKLFFLNDWDEQPIRRLLTDAVPQFNSADICADSQ